MREEQGGSWVWQITPVVAVLWRQEDCLRQARATERGKRESYLFVYLCFQTEPYFVALACL